MIRRPRPPDQWTVAGHSAAKVDGRSFVTGQASNTRRTSGCPGCGTARCCVLPRSARRLTRSIRARPRRCPMWSSSTTAISWASPRPAKSRPPGAGRDQGRMEARPPDLRQGPVRRPETARDAGEREGARKLRSASRLDRRRSRTAADVRLEQTYTIAYIAHAPLEPRAAVARVGGRQAHRLDRDPAAVRRARRAGRGLPACRRRRPGHRARHRGRLRRQAYRRGGRRGGPPGPRGRRSRSSWSGPARKNSPGPTSGPPASSRSTAASRRDGTLTAWEFHNYNSGGSGIRTLYEVPNQLVAFHQCRLASATGLLPRPRPPRPTISPASRTWTSSPMQ